MSPHTKAHLDHIADYQARLAFIDIFEIVGQLIERIERLEARLTMPAPPGPPLLLPADTQEPAPEPAPKSPAKLTEKPTGKKSAP